MAQFDRILKESQRDMDDAEANLERTRLIVEDRHEELTKYKNLKTKLEEADMMEERIAELTIEYSWSLVIAEELNRDQIKEDLDEFIKAKDKCSEACETLLKKKTDLVNGARATPEEIKDIKDKLRDGEKEEQDAHREITQLSRKMSEHKTTARVAQGQVTAYTHTIQTLEAKIEELTTTGAEEAESAKREYEEKTAKLEEEKGKCEAELQTLRNEKAQFLHRQESLGAQLQDLKAKEKELKYRVVGLKDEAKNLQNKNSRVSKYTAFGRQMEDLITKIEANQHKFKVLPRGPLGSCFTVKVSAYRRRRYRQRS